MNTAISSNVNSGFVFIVCIFMFFLLSGVCLVFCCTLRLELGFVGWVGFVVVV